VVASAVGRSGPPQPASSSTPPQASAAARAPARLATDEVTLGALAGWSAMVVPSSLVALDVRAPITTIPNG